MVTEPPSPTEPDAPSPGADLPDLIRTDGPPRPAAARIGLLLAAAVCLVLGIVFWLLPVVTGIPFYVAGLVFLGMSSRPAARWVNRQERRLPERYRRWIRRWKR